MSKVLEIFGKGITVNISDVINHWISQAMLQESFETPDSLLKILDAVANRELVPAKKQISDYLINFPDCIYGRMAAAAVCLLEGDLKEAINQTQSVYWRHPSNTMALYVMGYCYERLGSIEQAIEFYQDCVKFKSYLQLPRQRMAALYLKEGQVDKAIIEYEILTSEHPDDISSMILLGYLYLATNHYSLAIDTFNLGILSHPDNFSGSLKDDEIQSLMDCGMFDQAIEMIKSTIQQMGPSQDLIVRMGDIYSQWEKDSQAIICYENAIRVQPNSLEATIKLGTHYLRNQRFSLAAEQFNHASEINDEIVDAYMGLAIAQKSSGLTDEAIQTLNLASSIQKNSVLLFSEAATLQFQSIIDEKYDTDITSDKEIVTINKVISSYYEQLKRYKNRPDIYYKYGILLLSEDNLKTATEAFEHAVSLNSLNYRALHHLVICRYDNNEFQKSLDTLRTSDLAGAGIYQKYYEMTMLYTDKQAFAKAIKKLGAAKVSGTCENAELRANLEDMLESLGIVERSYTSWERINETSEYLEKILFKGHIHNNMNS